MKDKLLWGGLLLFIVIVSIVFHVYKTEECAERGGVWLSREGICVSGLQRIK